MAHFSNGYGGSAGGNFRLELHVNVESQDVGSNTSVVRIIGKFREVSATSVWNGNPTPWSVNVDGQGWSGSFAYNLPTNGEIVFLNTTKTIYHNGDGTKSIGFSASHDGQNSPYLTTSSGSGSLTLPTIPRASTPSLSGNPCDIGNNLTINTNRLSSAFTHRIRAVFGSFEEILATGVTTQFAWNTSTHASSLFAQIPNVNQGNGTIHLDTYNGATLIGTRSIMFTLRVVNSNPEFTDFDYQDSNSAVVAVTGDNQAIVQGQSTLRATIDSSDKMVAQNGATPNQYGYSIDSINATEPYSASTINKTLGPIPNNGVRRLTVTAFDSRNNSTAVFKDITVIPYALPIVQASVARLNGFEDQTTLEISGSYSQVIVGTPKNTVHATTGVRYRYREVGGAWGSWVNKSATIGSGLVEVSDTILSLDNEKSFEFQVEIIDRLGSTVVDLSLGAGKPILYIGNNRTIGVNHKPEGSKEGLHIPAGDALWDYIYPVGRIYMTVDEDEDPNELYGGTWVLWAQGRTPVGVDTGQTEFNTVEKTGGVKTVTLNESQMPSHTHIQNIHSHANSHVMGTSGGQHGFVDSGNSGSSGRPNGGGTTATNQHTGGGGAHNNLQPFITCYLWKRTS